MPSAWKYNPDEASNHSLGMAGFDSFNDKIVHSIGSQPAEIPFQQVITTVGGIIVLYSAGNIDAQTAGYVVGDKMIITESTVPAYNGSWVITFIGVGFALVTGPTFSLTATGISSYDNVNVPDGQIMYHPEASAWQRIKLLDCVPPIGFNQVELVRMDGVALNIKNGIATGTQHLPNLLGKLLTGPFKSIMTDDNHLIAYKE